MVEELKLDEFRFLYGLKQHEVADAFGSTRQALWQKDNLRPSVIRIDRKAKKISFVRLPHEWYGKIRPEQVFHECSINLIKGKKRREFS